MVLVGAALLAGSFAIAAIWTAGRKALLEFVPDGEEGSYYGLYGLTTKISVLGSLIFSVVADVAGFRPALAVLLFPAAVGTLFLFLSFLCQRNVRFR